MRTCLHDAHLRSGATMVDFHGWEMPVRYTSIPEEHRTVRTRAGLFDLCHMGRLEITGPDALDWIGSAVTSDIAALEIGQARYGLVCDEGGGVIDDVICYRLDGSLLLVVNASNRETVIEWLESRLGGRDARLRDRTFELAMLAIQGPAALDVLDPLTSGAGVPLADLPYYRITPARVDGAEALVATTGYTGEHGFEVYLPVEHAPAAWSRIIESGGERVAPIGLGARDTLRVEAAMPLYGNELGRDINPYEAGLGFAVKLDKEPPFTGRDALARIREEGPRRKLIGLRIDSRKIARQGMKLYRGGTEIGAVTSGIPSPTLGYPIALALVRRDISDPEGIEVEIRGKRFAAIPEPLPFYSRTRKRRSKPL